MKVIQHKVWFIFLYRSKCIKEEDLGYLRVSKTNKCKSSCKDVGSDNLSD